MLINSLLLLQINTLLSQKEKKSICTGNSVLFACKHDEITIHSCSVGKKTEGTL